MLDGLGTTVSGDGCVALWARRQQQHEPCRFGLDRCHQPLQRERTRAAADEQRLRERRGPGAVVHRPLRGRRASCRGRCGGAAELGRAHRHRDRALARPCHPTEPRTSDGTRILGVDISDDGGVVVAVESGQTSRPPGSRSRARRRGVGRRVQHHGVPQRTADQPARLRLPLDLGGRQVRVVHLRQALDRAAAHARAMGVRQRPHQRPDPHDQRADATRRTTRRSLATVRSSRTRSAPPGCQFDPQTLQDVEFTCPGPRDRRRLRAVAWLHVAVLDGDDQHPGQRRVRVGCT